MLRIRRVRAPNPSPLTGSGTNSWILGDGDVAVIDPGPDLPEHLEMILSTLGPHERLTSILVTHPHRDHSALARPLAERTGAPVYGFGPVGSGRSASMKRLVAEGLEGGGEGADAGFSPDIRLADGDSIGGGGWQVTALHTPGHMGEHLCFAAGDVLFSGDHVMGWSTSLVSPPDGDMGAYMSSLLRLQGRAWSRFLPGHGEAVDDPAQRLAELLAHRRTREQQILDALKLGPATAHQIASCVYAETPQALLPAATRNTLAHLIDLLQKNLVEVDATPVARARFHLR